MNEEPIAVSRWRKTKIAVGSLFAVGMSLGVYSLITPSQKDDPKNAKTASIVERTLKENPLNSQTSRAKQVFLASTTDRLVADAGTLTPTVSTERPSSRFEFGGSYSRVYMKPDGNPSFQGTLGGAQGMYEYRPSNDIYAGLKLAFREGTMHGSAEKRTLFDIDLQERLGYTFYDEPGGFLFSVFSGAGYRHLAQKLSPTGSSPVTFRYNELYVPVGFLSTALINHYFAFGVNFTWMPQVYPTVTTSSLRGARWIISDTLKNFLVEVPMIFKLTKTRRFSIEINPFFEHWQDGHLTDKTTSWVSLDLPGNEYYFWGAEVNFGFAF
ncbi:MAG: hypothetical protein KGZ39_03745 [Simkania sp.]|nr:hypothetical protein [Simkania sp.]